MRFADLLGEPDDDGTDGPAAANGATVPTTDPTGSSGSFGDAPAEPAAGDDLAQWFWQDDEASGTIATPAPVPDDTTAVTSAAAGPVERPVDRTPVTGTARDDLLPARPAHHGRKRR